MAISINGKPYPLKGKNYQACLKPVVPMIDRLLAFVSVVLLSPVWLVNSVLALSQGKAVVSGEFIHDAIGRPLLLKSFCAGFFRNTAYLTHVAKGDLAFVGMTLRHQIDRHLFNDTVMPPGIISLYDIQSWSGLCDFSHEQLIRKQQSNNSFSYRLKILVRGVIAFLLYGRSKGYCASAFRLFGVTVDNLTMSEAVQWITADRKEKTAEIAFFVNSHSFNIAANNKQFKAVLNNADRIFADGSGVRLASAQAGFRLKDNVNGTDLLPVLCQSLAASGKSVFLLGAEPNIAETAATNLCRQYPGLRIAGTQHGFFSESQSKAIIQRINQSQASVLLLALGSPLQEQWLDENRHLLNIPCALAVGGLFDFYSDKVSRAPRWLREIGFEWVWRLLQEPARMWRRYLIGNALFLIRTFLFRKELML